MALRAMNAHRLRTFLTMLGIIIGISAVVSVVALGLGAQQQVMNQISELGTNTLDIFPGKDFGDTRAAAIETLVAADAQALAEQPYVDSATPNVSVGVTALYRENAATAQVTGVGFEHFRVRPAPGIGPLLRPARRGPARPGGGDRPEDRHRPVPHQPQPAGRVVLLGQMPVEIVGVLRPAQNSFGGSTPTFFVPYTAAATRLVGKYHLDSITLRIKDAVPAEIAQKAATSLLTERHGTKDFFIWNSDQIRQAITRTSTTLTLLVSAIAMIALLVGGIGVMNIMLVSVTERTREIGVRMAIGARQSDILQQFLIEAVLVCIVGGILGVSLALSLGLAVSLSGSSFQLSFSAASIVLAVACSSLIGIGFGFLPARSAARLDPYRLYREIDMHMLKTGVLACAVALAGCGAITRTTYEAPQVALPAQFEHAQPSAAAPAPGMVARLRRSAPGCMDRHGLARNPDLATAGIRVRRAASAGAAGGPRLLPQPGGTLSTGASRPLSGSPRSTLETSSATLSVGWELDLFDRLGAQRDAAVFEAQASEQDRQAVALSLAATTASLYWQLALANERLEFARQSLEYTRRTGELVEAQYRSGAVSSLERREARQALAEQQALLSQYTQARAELRQALNELLLGAEAPGGEPQACPRARCLPLPQDCPPNCWAAAPTCAPPNCGCAPPGQQRCGHRALLPHAVADRQPGGSSNSLLDLLANPVAALGASMTLPFLNVGEMRLSTAIARNQHEEAVVNFRKSLYAALAETEKALSARTELASQEQAQQRVTQESAEITRLYEARYRAGQVPLRTWLDAQERSRNTAGPVGPAPGATAKPGDDQQGAGRRMANPLSKGRQPPPKCPAPVRTNAPCPGTGRSGCRPAPGCCWWSPPRSSHCRHCAHCPRWHTAACAWTARSRRPP